MHSNELQYLQRRRKGKSGPWGLDPSSGLYVPRTRSIVAVPLADEEPALQPARDIAEYFTGCKEPQVVTLLRPDEKANRSAEALLWVPAFCIWIPASWTVELGFLLQSPVDVANLPTGNLATCLTYLSVDGWKEGIWCATGSTPKALGPATPSRPLVVLWVCGATVYIVRYDADTQSPVAVEGAGGRSSATEPRGT